MENTRGIVQTISENKLKSIWTYLAPNRRSILMKYVKFDTNDRRIFQKTISNEINFNV